MIENDPQEPLVMRLMDAIRAMTDESWKEDTEFLLEYIDTMEREYRSKCCSLKDAHQSIEDLHESNQRAFLRYNADVRELRWKVKVGDYATIDECEQTNSRGGAEDVTEITDEQIKKAQISCVPIDDDGTWTRDCLAINGEEICYFTDSGICGQIALILPDILTDIIKAIIKGKPAPKVKDGRK